MSSALYEGWLTHTRYSPRLHHFRQKIAMFYLDLVELESGRISLGDSSRQRWRPVRYRRSDYLGDPQTSLSEAVKKVLQASNSVTFQGTVALLGQVRTLGWCFNPLTLYYCFDEEHGAVRFVVASVTNTPWHERRDYVMRADSSGRIDAWVSKEMHVSPFMSMDQQYHFQLDPPGPVLWARVSNHERGDLVSRAVMRLERRDIDNRAGTEMLARYPLITWRISARIYLEALKLGAKGIPFHPHPRRQRVG